MPARIGPSDRQHVIGFVARVVVVDYLKLRLPELFFELMDRVAGVPSNHCVLARLKDHAQRPGQQSGEIDQLGAPRRARGSPASARQIAAWA